MYVSLHHFMLRKRVITRVQCLWRPQAGEVSMWTGSPALRPLSELLGIVAQLLIDCC